MCESWIRFIPKKKTQVLPVPSRNKSILKGGQFLTIIIPEYYFTFVTTKLNTNYFFKDDVNSLTICKKAGN